MLTFIVHYYRLLARFYLNFGVVALCMAEIEDNLKNQDDPQVDMTKK